MDKICAGHPEIHVKAVREGWSKERAELEVLRASRPRGPAIHSENGTERSAESIEAALCLSAGMDEKWLAGHYDERTMNAALSRRMRDTTIHVVMDSVIHAAGRHYGGSRKSNEFIRAALDAERTLRASSGFSTMSLSGILSNVANKAMIAAYEAIETVHSAIAAYRSHSDFKVYTRYRLDARGAFQKVGPDGELKHVGLSEASYTNQLDTWGAIIALTRQMMINDDLGAFLEIPKFLGRMSAIAVEEEVFKLLLSNPNNFFSAGNNNLLTGAGSALSIDALGDAEKLFINQVDSNGKPILVTPRVLLVGAPLKTLADDLWNETQVMVTTTADKRRFATNPHKGKYRPFVSPYLNNTAITDRNGEQISGQSDTQWYLFADANIRAAMAVATLNGRRIPTIESDDASFDVLGMQWRAYHDFGVGMEDPVAAVKSAGA
ncbi:MAG TPA: hypothetical protein EYP56_00580 [Planctomycetaceae bacterium]|nr:hypothetical protein [Planctomycetaceae bacterium]